MKRFNLFVSSVQLKPLGYVPSTFSARISK